MNQSRVPQGPERLPDPVLQEPEEKHPYVPRPRWQVIMAWVLFGIVLLGILNLCYWEIFS